MSNTDANSSRNDEFPLPTMPSGDWEMNVFLNELAAELTGGDLKTMKHLLTGYNGSGKAVLEHIKDPIDLFLHLRQRLILTRDNIVCLQAMLWHTGRKDLHNKFVKFAKKRGNIVHFFAPSDKPENGYEFIKFHISGREKMNRHKLEELRMLVSNALCIPLEFVIASGIEATNSIMVTFMVPEGYANLFSDLDNKDKEYLGSKGVDAIWYNEQLINCIDVEATVDNESIRKDEEVKILLDQKSKLDQDVESLQIQVLKLDQSLRQCQKNVEMVHEKSKNAILTTTSALIQEFVDMKYTPEALSLQDIALKNSIRYCSHVLRKIEAKGYDTDLIKSLLEANVVMTRTTMKSHHVWIETQQQQLINKLKQDLRALRFERDKLAYFMKVGIDNPVLTENEEFFMRVIALNVPVQLNVTSTATTEVSMTVPGEHVDNISLDKKRDLMAAIFKMYESTLNDKERQILIKKFLPPQFAQKSFKDTSLLEYLWALYGTSNSQADFQVWIVTILAEIKRMDLYGYWANQSNLLIRAYTEEGEDIEHEDDAAGPGTLDSETPTKMTKKSGKDKKRKHIKQKQAAPIASPMTLEAMHERLQRIEAIFENKVKMPERFTSGIPEQKCFPGKSVSGDPYNISELLGRSVFTKN